MQTRRSASFLPFLALTGLMAVALTGCLERELKPLNPCLVSGVVAEISVDNVDKVDLLFVVDNSGSMAEEQDALKEQFPRLIQTLTSGMRPDGTTFPAAKDLHLAVVTTDMGLVGINGIDNCDNFGDDGRMQRMPTDPGCAPNPPKFLSYTENGPSTPTQVANEFGCLASVGTQGCGFEQQLEAGLKALWPSLDIDPNTGEQWVDPMTNQPGNRITFIGNTLGHGDAANDGFLRDQATEGLSLVAVIVVTDEEDCSSLRNNHFVPPNQLPADDPLRSEDLNLRCYYHPENLFDVDRYVEGFKALRPGNDNLVIFGAIAGVPQDLVTPAVLDNYDFTNEAEADAFYEMILSDTRMQERVQQGTAPGQGALEPSCSTSTGLAYPPRRIVEVAQGFGGNGIVQSICQDDFTPAMDAIIDVIARQLGAVCLPRKLVRNSEGKVGCKVIWELPAPNTAGAIGAPTSCADPGYPYLTEPEEVEDQTTNDGRARCVVDQLAVVDGMIQPAGADGWYYDDFSETVEEDCVGEDKQRIAFAQTPPSGITVKLECLSEVDTLIVDTEGAQMNSAGVIPQIGTPCDVQNGDQLCSELRLADGSVTDSGLFCHDQTNVCVRACTSNSDCPASWVCDSRPETRMNASNMDLSICVNPTCGTN